MRSLRAWPTSRCDASRWSIVTSDWSALFPLVISPLRTIRVKSPRLPLLVSPSRVASIPRVTAAPSALSNALAVITELNCQGSPMDREQSDLIWTRKDPPQRSHRQQLQTRPSRLVVCLSKEDCRHIGRCKVPLRSANARPNRELSGHRPDRAGPCCTGSPPVRVAQQDRP